MMSEGLLLSSKKSAKGIFNMLPVLLGVVLLIGLVNSLVPESYYHKLFGGNYLINSIIGSGLGSVLAGNPINSYIIGFKLFDLEVGLVAITAFMVAWVTVGVVQLPAESILLGRKFALWRNLISFVFSIVVALLTVFIVNLL